MLLGEDGVFIPECAGGPIDEFGAFGNDVDAPCVFAVVAAGDGEVEDDDVGSDFGISEKCVGDGGERTAGNDDEGFVFGCFFGFCDNEFAAGCGVGFGVFDFPGVGSEEDAVGAEGEVGDVFEAGVAGEVECFFCVFDGVIHFVEVAFLPFPHVA